MLCNKGLYLAKDFKYTVSNKRDSLNNTPTDDHDERKGRIGNRKSWPKHEMKDKQKRLLTIERLP